jgi:hypothetical protein
MKKQIRIKKGIQTIEEYGSLGCKNNLCEILVILKGLGFTEDDYKLVTFEPDFGSCYYEGDRPDVRMEWPNIY